MSRREFIQQIGALVAELLYPDEPGKNAWRSSWKKELVIGSHAWQKRVEAKYGIDRRVVDGLERYYLPEIKDRGISYSETQHLVMLTARNWGIPEKLLAAIPWSESYCSEKRAPAQWSLSTQEGGGDYQVIESAAGAVGLMQVYPPSHPESDIERLRSDIAYNINEGARILFDYSNGKADEEIDSWEEAVRGYKGPRIASEGWNLVRTLVFNPPTNPDTNKPAW